MAESNLRFWGLEEEDAGFESNRHLKNFVEFWK
jgi:hypothetical protein